MPRLPVLSAKAVVMILTKFGFQIRHQTGSHIHLWNEDQRILVTVPNHKELAKGILIAIMKQTNIEKDVFLSKLK